MRDRAGDVRPGVQHAAPAEHGCRARCRSAGSAGCPAPSRTSVVTTQPADTTTPAAEVAARADLRPRVHEHRAARRPRAVEPGQHRGSRSGEAEPEGERPGLRAAARPRRPGRPARAARACGRPASVPIARSRSRVSPGLATGPEHPDRRLRQLDRRRSTNGLRASPPADGAPDDLDDPRSGVPVAVHVAAPPGPCPEGRLERGCGCALSIAARSSAASSTLAPLTRPRCRSPTLTTGTPKLGRLEDAAGAVADHHVGGGQHGQVVGARASRPPPAAGSRAAAGSICGQHRLATARPARVR